tara:strand:+ start:496 stop:969 length:474 start_codon:yes stop_codon:yes gene_type:complete
MTTEYIYKNTLETLKKELPELSEQLPSVGAIVQDLLEFHSPTGNMRMALHLSDRVNVRWDVDGQKLGGAEGFFVSEIIDLIKDVMSEEKLFAIYLTDLELAKKHQVEIPEGIPTKATPQLIEKNKTPNGNNEYYYSNKIRLVSWGDTLNKEFYAPYQ